MKKPSRMTPPKVLAAEYRLALPDEKTLAAEIERTQTVLEHRAAAQGHEPAKRKGGRP
jgi:hypothetical protein